ncbi:hypothetical protein ISN45_Aa07g040560, partial [Arabidopsis thaliana x Arabidopsis arenosa]
SLAAAENQVSVTLCELLKRKMKDAVLSIWRRLKRLVIGIQRNAWYWTWLVYS